MRTVRPLTLRLHLQAAAFWVALACACGSRTGLEAAVEAPSDAAVPAPEVGTTDGPGVPVDATHAMDAPDVAADAPACAAPWVVFTLTAANTPQLFARRADGTGGHLVALASAAYYPSGAADGSALLFANAGVTQLFLYRFATGALTRLPTTGPVGFGNLSPDGKTVVFGDGADIRAVPVTTGPERLLVSGGTSSNGYPVFVFGSSTVLFASFGALQTIGIDGTGEKTVLTVDGNDGPDYPNPAVSPDGTQVAAIVSCSGEMPALRVYSLASLPAACTSGRVVTTVAQRLSYYDPAWGPWGPEGSVAYTASGDIAVVDVGSGAVSSLTSDLTSVSGVYASSPTWVSGCANVP